MYKISRAAVVLLLPLFVSLALGSEMSASGNFEKKAYAIQGSFQIKVVSGKTLLEIGSDFKTKSGPDLQWVFSPHSLTDANGKNAMDGAVPIGRIKSNKGAQTYELPTDLDLTKMKSLLIHCVKYSKLWGGASLP